MMPAEKVGWLLQTTKRIRFQEKRWAIGSGLTMQDAGGDGPNRLFGSILVVAGVAEG